MQTIFYLTISINDMIPGEEKFIKEEFNCYIFLNNDPVYKLILSDIESIAIIPINNLEDRIEFIFKKKNKPEIFGCVSIISKIFFPFLGQKVSQWITLFDSPDDDEFDGELGINDEECPKAFISFQIDPGNVNIDGNIYNQEFCSPIKQGANILGEDEQREEGKSKEKSSYKDKKNLKLITSSSSRKKNSDTSSMQLSRLLSPNTDLNNTQFNLNTDKQNPYSSANNLDSLSDNTTTTIIRQVGEKDMLSSQGRISNLISNAISESPSKLAICNNLPEELRYTEADIRKFLWDYEERIRLLVLDNQKFKEMESENTKLKVIIDENSTKYEESQQKIKVQFKQLFERSKELNEENYTLKKRISELEKEVILNKENLTEELKITAQNANQQAEFNKLNLQHCKLTIENLEKLCQNIKEQHENIEKVYKAEVQKNIKLNESQTELLTNYKKIVENSNALQTNLEQKLKQVEEERITLEEALQRRTNELEKQNLRMNINEVEMSSLKNLNDQLTKELADQKKHINALRDSIDDLVKEKEKEILRLRDALNKANLKINDIYSEYGKLQREKDFLDNEFNQLKLRSTNTDDISELQKDLEFIQDSKKQLEDQFNEARKNWCMIIEDYESNIHNPLNQETISKLEGKIKQLIEQFNIQMNECDKLKFANTNLQIKANELEYLTNQHDELKHQMETLRKAHEEVKNEHNETKKALHKTGHELIKQVNINISNGENIQKLEEQIKQLSEEFSQTLNENQKLQREINAIQDLNELIPFEPYIPKKNDEIDQTLAEFVNKTRVPIKFIRIQEGLYCFGSKKLNIKILSGKLVIRIGGGYMMFEDFVKIFTTQEMIKLRLMKNLPSQMSDIDIEEIPLEARSKIFKEETNSFKEPETHKQSDSKPISQLVITSSSTSSLSAKISPTKGSMSRYSPLKKNSIVERSSYNSNHKGDMDKNIGLIKNENLNQKGVIPSEYLSNNRYEISPTTVHRKKNRINKEIPERNKNLTYDQGSLSNSISGNNPRSSLDASKEKAIITRVNNSSSIRKDISPISKKYMNIK